MDDRTGKGAGIALIISALMITVTMVLHPVGGSIEHLRKISGMIVMTHSLALLSIPPMALGGWWVTKNLDPGTPLGLLAFVTFCTGLVAVMIAGAVNGLVVPLFLSRHPNIQPDELPNIQLILQYGFSINRAMDYIFIVGCCISLTMWSLMILRKKGVTFPTWLGYLGVLLCLTGVGSLALKAELTSLMGFRVVIGGLVGWIVLAGYFLYRKSNFPADLKKRVDR